MSGRRPTVRDSTVETVAQAHGRVLDLGDADGHRNHYPPTVTELVVLSEDFGLDDLAPDDRFDCIVSIEQLPFGDAFETMLGRLLERLGPGGALLFLESDHRPGLATLVRDVFTGARLRPARDVTGSLWAGGWTVVDSRRFDAGGLAYVYGSARLSRFPRS